MAKMTTEERRVLLNGSSEPTINVLDYTNSLARALNYYNVEADSKKKRKYAEVYAKKVLGLDVSVASDYLLNTIGAMCRLIDRGEPISDFDIARTHDGLTKLSTGKVRAISSVTEKADTRSVSVKPKKTPEQIADELANKVIEDIEVAIDELVMKEGPGGSDFNIKGIDVSNAKTAKICAEHFERRLASFEEAKDSSEADIKEAYSHISRRKMTHIINFLNEVITKVKQSAAVAKVNKPRKVRVKKEKPARVLVSKMVYLKKSEELNIESVNPEDIVGSSEVILFNTKTRKLSIVRALDGMTLSVKGKSIVNFDPTKSVNKTIRKPIDQLPSFIKVTKRNALTAFNAIKATEGKANGRVAEETLILTTNK